MDDVEPHVAGSGDAADGVEVRAVVVHERAGAVEDPLDLLDPLVEQAERRGVREHQARGRFVDLAAQVVEVDVPARVRRHLHELVAGHRHARRVRPVRRVRDDDLPPLLVLAAVREVRAHQHQARQLTLRACRRLQRHGVEPADLGEDLLQAPHQLERTLGRVLLLQRMEVREPRQSRDDLVDARVVLHRARAERIEAGVDAEVPRRQLGEVANELRLGDLGQARRLGAAKAVRHRRRLDAARRKRVRAPPRLRTLVDELHRRDLAEHLDEPVDVRRRPLLRHGDEQAVVHAGVVAAKRVAGVHAALACRPHDVSCVSSDADGKLLERCLIRKQRLESRVREPLRRVCRRGSCRSPPAPAGLPGRAT